MSEIARTLRDRRLNVWERAKEIADKATEENRALTPEEQGGWDQANDELNKLDARIKSVLEAEKRSRDADDAFDAITGKTHDAVRRAAGRPDAGDNEIRRWLRGENGTSRVLELTRDPNRGPINYRSLLNTPALSGGAMVPTDFYDQLLAHLIEVSGVLQTGPTIVNTAGGEPLQFPRTVTHSTAVTAAQAGTIPTSEPSFGVVTLGAFKYGCLLQVSRELLDDSAVDLVGYLSMQAGRALGNAFGADLVTGTGTAQPDGLVKNATVGVTGATGQVGLARYQDLVNLEYSVIAPYRQSRSCYWLAADRTIGNFRLLTDTQGRPIWEPSVVLGAPDMLLGKPIVSDPFMPAATTGAKSIMFGDFAEFAVRLVGPVRFERSDDFAFDKDLVTFRAVIRGDGTLIDRTGACMKYYIGNAAV